jgi:hypothetical protein
MDAVYLGVRGAPWEYIEKCEVALTAYEDR